MRFLLLFLLNFFSLVLVSCLDNSSTSNSSTGSTVGSPAGFNSSLNATPQSSTGYVLVRLDGSTPIDGSEDSVLVCTPEKNYCTQTCLSVYSPQYERWSVFKTDFLNGGKCVGFAMAYSNGTDIPRAKMWIGNYVQSGNSVVGRCVINFNSPDFDGRAYFSFVRPQNASAYYLHSFYDLSNNPLSSIRLLNFNPPGLWTFHDSSITNADITPQLTNYSCVKENAISGAFQ